MFLYRASYSCDDTGLFELSSLPKNFETSRFSNGVPTRVEGRFMMLQLSGCPVGKAQIPFWIARRNLAVGAANAFFFCIMVSRVRGTFSPDDRMISLSVSMSSGDGFLPLRVPRFSSIC